MILYYYTSLVHGLTSIRDKRIKISSFDTLNDPFDILNIAAKTEEQRNDLKKIRDRLTSKGGMICASENWNEPLMWSHYADKHAGVCVALRVDPTEWRKVQYANKRLGIEAYNVKSIEDLSHDQLEEISTIKSDFWTYEQEWRRFYIYEEKDYVTNLDFGYFDRAMMPIGLIFGHRAKVGKERIASILSSNPSLKIGITRPAYTSFKVLLDQTMIRKQVDDKARLKYDFKDKSLFWQSENLLDSFSADEELPLKYE
ncbi:DUF2971 domain-containing protein [Agrobacterium sp. SORGH_AS 787]|uniref:DUF2971 domain-containing protein n=1 Tax=Agrobacterium sp. SORGH_AS 787 TaxID=3041775 RepID=UPI002784394C|nr:hypothetical protein [Rhizobium sp. SORGH_AS_0787]